MTCIRHSAKTKLRISNYRILSFVRVPLSYCMYLTRVDEKLYCLDTTFSRGQVERGSSVIVTNSHVVAQKLQTSGLFSKKWG